MERDKTFDSYELALRLEKARSSTGKTQQEVADDLGINRNQIKVWECGTREIKAKDLFTLSKYYGVSVDYLLGLTECASSNTDLRAACDYTGLSETALRILRGDNEEGFSCISTNVLNFLIENENIINLFGNVELYLKFDPLDKRCAFDDKGNMAECSEENMFEKLEEMRQSRLANGTEDFIFVQAIKTEKIINSLILSDIESGLGRARKEYQKEHLNFAGEKKEG